MLKSVVEMTSTPPHQNSSSVFHSEAWRKVLQETYGYQYFCIKSPNSNQTKIPLLEVSSRLTGKRGISLPFTDRCEPTCQSKGEFEDLLQQTILLGKDRSWNYFELRGGRQFLQESQASSQFYTHSVQLNIELDKIFERFSSANRRCLRKASRSAVSISQSSSIESLNSFYKLQCLTRKRHGLPPQPFRFFQKIHEHLIIKGLGQIITASIQNKPIASAIFLHYKDQATYKYGASDITQQRYRPNNLIMWHAIKHYTENGYKGLDLGRTSLHHEGLRRFKNSWGSEEARSSYFRYDLRINKFVTASDDTKGWHTKVFSKLPISLSRIAGTLLYRHIA